MYVGWCPACKLRRVSLPALPPLDFFFIGGFYFGVPSLCMQRPLLELTELTLVLLHVVLYTTGMERCLISDLLFVVLHFALQIQS
jgi:hypothetical protein